MSFEHQNLVEDQRNDQPHLFYWDYELDLSKCNDCRPTCDGKVYDPPSPHEVDKVFHDHCLSYLAPFDCSHEVEKVVGEDHYGDVTDKVGNQPVLIGQQHVL